MARNVVVREGNLQFGGVRYFRGQAEEVELGSIGEKRTPIGAMNRLEVKDQIPMGTVKSAKAVVVDIDFTKTTKAAFKRSGKVAAGKQSASVSASGMFEGLRSGSLKLVKFSVMNNDMRRAANSSPAILRQLVHWGNRARIAHQIFVVMKAELARSFGASAQVDSKVSVTAEGITVEGSGRTSASVSGRTKVVLSPGTTFAYLLLKIDWNAKAKRKKTHIVDLDEDQAGIH
jgi:hypothetical protein